MQEDEATLESVDQSDQGASSQKQEVEYLTTIEFILMNLSRHYSQESYSLYTYEDANEMPNFFHVFVVYIFVGIPVGYMEMLLGQYTNKGMFHIKHILPVAHGMSYTFCLQVLATTILCVLLMTEFAVYTMLSLISGGNFEWLECPKNYTNTCFAAQTQCTEDGPCITRTRHLSTYIYWDTVYMEGVLNRKQADIAVPSMHRIEALITCWAIVYATMTLKFTMVKRFITIAYMVVLGHKVLQFIAFIFWLQYLVHIPRMINVTMASLWNFTAWTRAIVKVTVGMGLGDFTYILFGIFSKSSRNTGSLIWFCGLTSFFLSMTDHIIISGATYDISSTANLPIDDRYLLFQPTGAALAFGFMPIALSHLGTSLVWNVMYFLHEFLMVLFQVMLNYSFLQLSLYQRYPTLQFYGLYTKPLFCICGFAIALILDSKEAYAIRYDISHIVMDFCNQCNITIMTIIVFYIYGVAKFCDDVHFITGEEPTKYWKSTWIMSPIFVIFSVPVELFDSTNWLFAHRMVTIIIFYSPYIIFFMITLIQHIREKKLITLFHHTAEWGPKDTNQRVFRKSFNPRVDSKRKNKAYVCPHKCLILDRVVDSDEEEESNTPYNP